MKKILPRILPVLVLLLVLLFVFQPFSNDTQNTTTGSSETAALAAGSPDAGSGKQANKPGENPRDASDNTTDGEEFLDEHGSYTTKEDVSLYLLQYGRLPENFITKNEARKLGWEGGSLEKIAPGMCIGGDRFGNREGLLPKAKGRTWTECDLNTLGRNSRGAERLLFSNDGLIYYTDDHYESFTLLYGEP